MENGNAVIDTTAYSETPPNPKYPGPGFRIGEYLIREILGHGAMATVYLANDSTGHEVALKVFVEGPGVSATMLERFRREAEASKKLRRHPHIVTIYATGKEGPYQYIAMESIKRSKTFEAALESTPMSLKTIVEVIIKIARAMQYAHSRGIVHRDVKPTNIMVDEFGEPLLADFGVATFMDGPSCTMTGALTGTPLYMSPEQARGERVGPLSDIYSLGVVLFEAATGVLPYTAHHRSRVREVLDAVKDEAPRRPRLFRREISPDLEAVMLKALEKHPEDRYPDAEAFALDLERALAGKRVSAHHFSQIDRLRHLTRLYRPVITGILATLLVLGLLLWWSHQRLRYAHYENAVNVARLISARRADRLTPVSDRDVSQTDMSIWYDLQRARRWMLTGDWRQALQHLDRATELCQDANDGRALALVSLERARCVLMRGHRRDAKTLYAAILKNPDASPPLRELALMELLLLLRVDGQNAKAVALLGEYGLPAYPPVEKAVRCIAGDISPETLAEAIGGMPASFRNDAWLALALRQALDGNREAYRQAVEQSIKVSRPAMEWPGPMARQIYRRLD
jgi:serine/threonine protein kinase